MIPVSIAFCCNNPNTGRPTGKFCSVNFGDNLLELNNQFWPPREFALRFDCQSYGSNGFAAARVTGTVKISRRKFPIVGYKYGWGNWCWDLVIVEPPVALEILNYLKTLNAFSPESGEVTFWAGWDADRPFDLVTFEPLLEKWGYAKP